MLVQKKKHIITESSKHFLINACPKMKVLIDEVGVLDSYYITDPFTSLVNSIVFQSISYKAASVIWGRLLKKLTIFTPESINKLTFHDLKSVGLSNSKTQYIFNITDAFINKEIDLNFAQLSNDEIMKNLQEIKGIGPWTSEMFLIFCLYRKNVFSFGDIAIRRGLEFMHNIKGDISKKQFEYYKDLYSKELTIASLYIWEITLRNLFKKESLFIK